LNLVVNQYRFEIVVLEMERCLICI
jgi:hypothetical protein